VIAGTLAVSSETGAGAGSVGNPVNVYPSLNKPAFIELAKNSSCNDRRNRLFVIESIASEEKLVLWARDGACSDNGYARRLYNGSPDHLLCETHDSIMWPQSKCNDEK